MTRLTPKAHFSDSVWRKIRHILSSRESDQPFPQIQECIIHLRLMRAFARLRQGLVDTMGHKSCQGDELDIHPKFQQHLNDSQFRDDVWQMYLQLAADRFEAWWTSTANKLNRGQGIAQIDLRTCREPGALQARIRDTKPMVWTESNLPPLDVIMILHSFMLNPRAFLEDCIRFNMLSLWKAGMPWHLLDKAIDPSNGECIDSLSAQNAWKTATACPWDIREARLERSIQCPACTKTASYQTAIMRSCTQDTKPQDTSEDPFICCVHCGSKFNDDQLKLYKFRQAIDNLVSERHVPLPGTILSMNGLPGSRTDKAEDMELLDLNTIIVSNADIQNIVPPYLETPATSQPDEESIRAPVSLSQAKTSFEAEVDKHITDYTPIQKRAIKLALKRTFLQISDTSSTFALDLSTAVLRQCEFINQMETTDWLHSPALNHTIDELLARYKIFFDIMGQNKDNIAVPTYAVDLAWHTHQLSPSSYYAYSITHTPNIFINHDDRIAEDTRIDAFSWTGQQYFHLTHGKDYSRCLCWYCATAHDLFGDDQRELVHGENGCVYFDARPDEHTAVLSAIAAAQYRKLKHDYGVACCLAAARDREPPGQEEFLNQYVWKYPEATPVVSLGTNAVS